MAPVFNMSVGDLADRLAKATNLSKTFHARQLRAQIREGALTSPVRGGSGLTAPTLFDETGLARAMVLHTLAMIGLEMPLLRQASAASGVVDPTSRKGNVVEPQDGMAFTLSRLRADRDAKMYLHLSLSEWPGDDGDLSLGGWVSNSATPAENPVLSPLVMIVLPLHSILKPVLGLE